MKKKIIKKWKIKAIATKHCKTRGRIDLFSVKKRNYKSDIIDNTD